jgi:hypothetical protein
MILPIIRGESYVGETGKSMKAAELARPQKALQADVLGLIHDTHTAATELFQNVVVGDNMSGDLNHASTGLD